MADEGEFPRKRARVAEDDNIHSSSGLQKTVKREKETTFSQPPMNVDWRGVLCQFLDISSQEEDNSIISSLKRTADRLEASKNSHRDTKAFDIVDCYQTIHRIRCDQRSTPELSLEIPWAVENGSKAVHLRSGGAIDNLPLYLERNKQFSFIVYKEYACCNKPYTPARAGDDSDISNLTAKESMCIVSEEFRRAFEELWSKNENAPHPQFKLFLEIPAPCIWWYSQREELERQLSSLHDSHTNHIRAFQHYLKDSLGDEYNNVDALLSKERITPHYLPYLYIPGEIQILKNPGDEPEDYNAFVATSWLKITITDYFAQNQSLPGKSWTFDGEFSEVDLDHSFRCEFSKNETFAIQDLEIYPIRFADPGTICALRKRGEMFWECRLQKYFCYRKDASSQIQNSFAARYMVDMNTYNEFHSEKKQHANANVLGEDTMKQALPPQEDSFLLCIPNTLPGFHMQKKTWKLLYVNRISPVKWNTDAFEKLVVEKQQKELIRALVTNQISAEEGTDLMGGKGNGLFILLHGGPGTGKTLTAESVAEIAEKPLYRATCGDVGTEPEKVEEYLETVMELGKTWDCVVLLDEADVFLMQRSVEDFQRNALVTVFLRVLEYFDGIIILTSNRVGTLDPAFKPRIQLFLCYPKLVEADRLKIWANFIEHIESQTSSRTMVLGIKSREIKSKLGELAKEELNGREIRNAVSTARQLAMYNETKMGYEHLCTAIGETRKFARYAQELKRDFTDDEIAKMQGER